MATTATNMALSFPEPTPAKNETPPSFDVVEGPSSMAATNSKGKGEIEPLSDVKSDIKEKKSTGSSKFSFRKRKSSESSRKSKDDPPSTSDLPPPPDYKLYRAEFTKDDGGDIASYDKHLNEDGEALFRFLLEHGSVPPRQYINVLGTHMEQRTRTVHRNGYTVVETYSVTITDFSFYLNISSLILEEEEPVLWSESDETPAWRGAMKMQTEPAGPVSYSSRVPVIRAQRKEQEAWEQERANRGIAPWKPHHKKLEEQAKVDAKASAEAKFDTECSGRTMRQWADDYAHSPKKLKDFKFKKVIYGWDFEKLKESIHTLIRGTDYHGDIAIQVRATTYKIHVRSPGSLSERFHDPCSIFLLSLLLVYPGLWLWRRFSKNGGGEWAIGGTAWALKKWVKVEGTFDGETIENCRARLAYNGSSLSPDTEFKLGRGGVYILRGTQEGHWFRTWAETIREAVNSRVSHGSALQLIPPGTDAARLAVAGAGLDGF